MSSLVERLMRNRKTSFETAVTPSPIVAVHINLAEALKSICKHKQM